jgi:hypothetical protein
MVSFTPELEAAPLPEGARLFDLVGIGVKASEQGFLFGGHKNLGRE